MFKPLTLSLILCGTTALAAPNVVTDIAPIQSLAAQVMNGVATPDLLIPPGMSPHDYALRPSNAAALEAADMVIWIGPELSPGLERSMETLADAAQKLTLLSLAETDLLETRDTVSLGANDHSEDHDHSEGHSAGEDHDHDHSHGGTDPHAWLDPENGKAWLGVIAERLAELDPENADTYRSNAAAGQAQIDAAMNDITQELSPYAGAPYVVFHDAYQYFERHFDLAPVGAISLSDASDPSPARVAELRDIVADAGAACVFSEPQFNRGLVNAVFDGSTARTAVIDPLGTTLTPGPGLYPALLRDLARTIASCL